MRSLFLVLCAVFCSACTFIHIEGNSNTVSDIEGHTTDLKVPVSADKPLVMPPYQ
ncbi:hypothetical protein P3T23_004538 [Paraburkholderia sp. GAS448]|uniref:hypothetical protein n=1 Tax=Paraburkholderia sp. GAS448 TaxID=3035136 RepID=UPI003D1E4149